MRWSPRRSYKPPDVGPVASRIEHWRRMSAHYPAALLVKMRSGGSDDGREVARARETHLQVAVSRPLDRRAAHCSAGCRLTCGGGGVPSPWHYVRYYLGARVGPVRVVRDPPGSDGNPGP